MPIKNILGLNSCSSIDHKEIRQLQMYKGSYDTRRMEVTVFVFLNLYRFPSIVVTKVFGGSLFPWESTTFVTINAYSLFC